MSDAFAHLRRYGSGVIVGIQNVADLTAPVVEVKKKLSPQDLDGLIDHISSESSLNYDGHAIQNSVLRAVRFARKDFRSAQSIVVDGRRPRAEKLSAAKVMGHKRGIWFQEFGQPFGIPSQEGLVIDKAVFGDTEACDAMIAGFKEQMLATNVKSPILELYREEDGHKRATICAEDACTLFECAVKSLQRCHSKTHNKSRSKKPGRKA